MNRDEAKNILLLYRSEADSADPQIAAALAFIKNDPGLRAWFEGYSAQQKTLREKFRQIPAPPGLKEQIISERKVMAVKKSRRDKIVAGVAAVAIVASLIVVAAVYFPHRPPNPGPANTFANYEGQMLYVASYGYSMSLATNDLTQIRAYLTQNQSPADYALPAALQKTTATGCTVQSFQGAKVSMICFATGKPLPPGHPGDLWLFVAPASSLIDSPASPTPQLAEVDGDSVATWTQGGKIYLLATPGDQQAVQKYL